MNKSRRMVALQARALALHGFAVAIVDLRGTGDSYGEHSAATWDGWFADVVCAWSWLGTLAPVPRLLWGLRLGALLAADLVAQDAVDVFALVLWQPILAGRLFFSQILRYATARQIVAGSDARMERKLLENRLREGIVIEVAGYGLHPALVIPAERRSLSDLLDPTCMLVWHETTALTPVALNAASVDIIAKLRNKGAHVESTAVDGPSFWATQEITEAPNLIRATTNTIERLLR